MSEQHYFRINGMSCRGCVDTVEAAIRSIKGVESVEVDLETGMAIITGDVSSDVVMAAIDSAGYNAILIPE